MFCVCQAPNSVAYGRESQPRPANSAGQPSNAPGPSYKRGQASAPPPPVPPPQLQAGTVRPSPAVVFCTCLSQRLTCSTNRGRGCPLGGRPRPPLSHSALVKKSFSYPRRSCSTFLVISSTGGFGAGYLRLDDRNYARLGRQARRRPLQRPRPAHGKPAFRDAPF